LYDWHVIEAGALDRIIRLEEFQLYNYVVQFNDFVGVTALRATKQAYIEKGNGFEIVKLIHVYLLDGKGREEVPKRKRASASSSLCTHRPAHSPPNHFMHKNKMS
jgi:hypothetical protein